jgi:ribosomal protein S9
MAKFDVAVKLTGTDGNAYAVMGAVSKALKKAGATKEQVDAYMAESMSGDYNHLIATACDWVEVS